MTAAYLEELARNVEQAADVRAPLDLLIDALSHLRQAAPPEEWKALATGPAMQAVQRVMCEDPFTRHSRTRPRGYPGDALLLDYIYRMPNVEPELQAASELGRRINTVVVAAPSPQAVRNRTSLAAVEIDRLAGSTPGLRVLSVACGHMRELTASKARLGRIVGVDQDPLSVAFVQSQYGGRAEARVQSAFSLVRERSEDTFDFIYALGLYDYLSDEFGARLLAKLFEHLAPGGQVWVANFVPNLWSSGYMEACMDWWLNYRTPANLRTLADNLPSNEVESVRVFLEQEQNVAVLEVRRRG